MLDTVGPLPIIKPRSHLQNSNSASETPICGPYPCPSWRKAIRRERHYSQEHETSHLPIRMGHTLLWSGVSATGFPALTQGHGWNP